MGVWSTLWLWLEQEHWFSLDLNLLFTTHCKPFPYGWLLVRFMWKKPTANRKQEKGKYFACVDLFLQLLWSAKWMNLYYRKCTFYSDKIIVLLFCLLFGLHVTHKRCGKFQLQPLKRLDVQTAVVFAAFLNWAPGAFETFCPINHLGDILCMRLCTWVYLIDCFTFWTTQRSGNYFQRANKPLE